MSGPRKAGILAGLAIAALGFQPNLTDQTSQTGSESRQVAERFGSLLGSGGRALRNRRDPLDAASGGLLVGRSVNLSDHVPDLLRHPNNVLQG
jgi:hypothetical protein